MSEPLLNVMKIMLLAGLYLFFIRVLWSVFSELRDPRTIASKRKGAAATSIDAPADLAQTIRRPVQHAPQVAVTHGNVASPAPARSGSVATAARGQLHVLEPPEIAGSLWDLGREITLGRAHTNGIVLDDTYVSTVHARIFLTNNTYVFEDLASRNGSTINGQPVVAATPLVPGDMVQLGATTMEFA